MKQVCRECEYYDDGTGIKRTGKSADCLNNHSSPRFQTKPNMTCKGFYPNTTLYKES